MTDIFLSYTERDRDTARRIAGALGSAGWNVWWDRRIPAGETWRNVLEDALEDMRCMVVLWSSKSIESEWVYEEASEGRRQGKLVPVLIENVRPPAGFREIQAADLTDWDGSPDFDGLHMLLADLENLLGKPAAAQASRRKNADQADITPVNPTLAHGLAYDTADPPRRDRPANLGSGHRRTLTLLAAAMALTIIVAYLTLLPKPPEMVAPPPPAAAPTVPAASSPAVASQAPIASPPASASRSPLPEHPAPQLATPDKIAPTVTPSKPSKHSGTSSLGSARCADLLARIQLGETLSDVNQSQFNRECRQ